MRRTSIGIVLICAVALLASSAATHAATLNGKIVFASDRDGNYDIWQMNPDGSGQAKIGGSATQTDDAPSVSPDGSKIAFVRGAGYRDGEIWVMNADGTGQTMLASFAADPSWSPNGQQIAFGVQGNGDRPNGIWTMNADGTGQTKVVDTSERDHWGPSWSPDGQKIVFHVNSYSGSENAIWSVNADGSNLTPLTDGVDTTEDTDPDWSPDGSTIAFARLPWCCQNQRLYKMNADGSGETQIHDPDPLYDHKPAWSPDGSRIAFYRRSCCTSSDDEIYSIKPDGTGESRLTNNIFSDRDPDWTPQLGPAYPRPKSATPLLAALAIAYEPCESPNRQHGPTLAVPSCNPPAMSSDYLTVGTLDANGMPPRAAGSVRLDVVPDMAVTPPDESDVKMSLSMTDVFTKALADYAGELRTSFSVQITDRDNIPAPPYATTQELSFGFTAGCVPTADPTTGSSCAVATTANAVAPGAAVRQNRAIWQLGLVQVFDGGADEDGDTTADNTLFATQGIFTP